MFSPLENESSEQWFQRLNAPLKRLPAEQRAELHAEVRQHLEALAAANEELGSTPEEAWEHALAQFGDPGNFGKRMAQEWHLGQNRLPCRLGCYLCLPRFTGISVRRLLADRFAGSSVDKPLQASVNPHDHNQRH